MNRLIKSTALGLSVLIGCSLCACGVTDSSLGQKTEINPGLWVEKEVALEPDPSDILETYGTDCEMLADFLKGVKTPVIVDEVIADKLLPYAEALAKGQQDAESATQAAEKDLRLYLAERG